MPFICAAHSSRCVHRPFRASASRLADFPKKSLIGIVDDDALLRPLPWRRGAPIAIFQEIDMGMFKPAAPASISTYGFTATQLELVLSADAATTFRQLRHVLTVPEDAPRLNDALQAAVDAVAAYGVLISTQT